MTADEYSTDLATRKRASNVIARGEAYRFTPADESTVLAARDAWIGNLRREVRQSGHDWNAHAQLAASHNREALRRVMSHSIGCGLIDLRDSEIDWIDAQIEAVTL